METKQKIIRFVAALLVLGGLMALPISAGAGSLEPSAPPGPTMKTLDEVEPRVPVQTLPGDANSLYVISEAGSYYLAGNITGQAGKHGIKIDANNVTLDLMGFVLMGVPGSLDGICVQYRETDEPLPIEEVSFNVCIRNGTVRKWCGDGIHIGPKTFTHMENVSFAYNGGNGMYLGTESYTHMEDVSFAHNGGHGLYVDANSSIHMKDVSSFYNTGHGAMLAMMTNVDAYSGYLSSFSHNGGNGMHIANGTCSHIENLSFNNNDGKGMYIGSESYTYMEQVCFRGNKSDGLYVDANSCAQMENVSFSHNGGHGVFMVYGMLDAFGVLAPHNGGGGIIVGGSGNLNRCTAVGNGSIGIQAGTGSTVKNCTTRGNIGDGILVSNNCQVIGNSCENNCLGPIADTAGIRATGSGNRIEANHVVNNNRGVYVSIAGNLIIKNSATGNTTNYDIAGGNTKGPTIGSGDIVSDNPHGNYDF